MISMIYSEDKERAQNSPPSLIYGEPDEIPCSQTLWGKYSASCAVGIYQRNIHAIVKWYCMLNLPVQYVENVQ